MNNNHNVAELRKRLHEKEDELALLMRLSRTISTELVLDRTLILVAEMARQVIEAETLVVPLIDEAQQRYCYAAASGYYAEHITGKCFPLNTGMCGWVLTHDRPLLFGEGHDWPDDARTQWEQGIASALLVPLVSRGRSLAGCPALENRVAAASRNGIWTC